MSKSGGGIQRDTYFVSLSITLYIESKRMLCSNGEKAVMKVAHKCDK